jgi:AraC-like DNA-binding protein
MWRGMLKQDYLTLRLVRLHSGEEWLHKGGGLCLVFARGGAGKYMAGPTSQRFISGDVLVLSVPSGGKITASDRSEVLFWCFSVCLEHLFPLFAGNEISLLQSVTDGFKSARLLSASTPLAKECHRLLAEVPPQFNLDHRSQLLRIVAAILTVEFKTASGQRVGFVRAEEHMIQVFEKLSSNDLLSLSVGELADKFSCSRRHLNRLFHQHFGFSVAALRMEMRLLKAVSLLRDPDAKIINVAEQCGFNHLGLFNTCFKRRFGSSPGQWRKLTVESENQTAGLAEATQVCPLRTNGLCPWSGKPEYSNPVLLANAADGNTPRLVSMNGSANHNGHVVSHISPLSVQTEVQRGPSVSGL